MSPDEQRLADDLNRAVDRMLEGSQTDPTAAGGQERRQRAAAALDQHRAHSVLREIAEGEIDATLLWSSFRYWQAELRPFITF